MENICVSMAIGPGRTSMVYRGFFFNVTLYASAVAVFILSHLFLQPVLSDSSYLNHGVSYNAKGPGIAQRLLASESDLLKLRLDRIRKQAQDYKNTLESHISNARKITLYNTRLVRIFAEISQKYSDIMLKPEYRSMLNSDEYYIDKMLLRKFEKEVKETTKSTREAVEDAAQTFDYPLQIQKMKDRLFALNEKIEKEKFKDAYSSMSAAKGLPWRLHCVAMKLMEERHKHEKLRLKDEEHKNEEKPFPPELEDPNLYHYAIFSDNVVAASVVLNSAIQNAKEPLKHVFHVVTDKMNLGTMRLMLKMTNHNRSHVEVKAVEQYKFLNSSYVPVLRQAGSAKLQKFYFEHKMDKATRDATNMKFRNPKYVSILNHARFYLPEMFPKLHMILFLDDDIVVQKDLTGLWDVDMDGMVNGAVETCFGSFHRYSQYMNFNHPLIKHKIDPNKCAWAYGMNFFDLNAWRREKCTEEYHYWQTQNENRTLWRLGTLPAGLITFYSTTKALDKSWHVLGLGYNPRITMEEIKNAAVVHYNGNLKPWLDIGMPMYRSIWTKYVDYSNMFIQSCDFSFQSYGNSSE